jgi:NAD(P)-dependent dehydrogenase (short-subunit alcohol dehydrogenase family)
MNPIRFDGRVAVVTGAGGGLGRAHALLLAARGATVVVNDLGGSVGGQRGDTAAASAVVREIEAAGGRALANFDDIATPEGVQALLDAALAAFGRVDILVNNAGILGDKTLHKLPASDFEAVVQVHLLGSAWCSRAALPAMQAQHYGRIVMTTSAAVWQLRPEQLQRSQAGRGRLDEHLEGRRRQVRHHGQHHRAGGPAAHDRGPALRPHSRRSLARARVGRRGLAGQRGLHR